MFFQFMSPPEKVKKVKEVKVVETEDVTVISLAPFTHNPKVSFQDVSLGVTVTKKLHIKNPTKFDVELCITKGPPEERDVCYTWVEQMVPSEDSVFLELTWTPKEIGSWRDVISLEDGHRIRKDIPLIFKSVSPKKMSKKPKKQIKPIAAKIKPSKSPTKKVMPTFKSSPLRKRSPPKIRVSPVKTLKEKPEVDYDFLVSEPEERRQTYNVNNKENLPVVYNAKSSPSSPCSDILEDSLESFSNVKSTPLVNHIRNTFNFDGLVLTPVMDNFNPSVCSSGEKSRLNATYDLKHNLSRGTYVLGENSLGSPLDGKVKGTSPSGTYVKPSESVGNSNLKDLEEFGEGYGNSTFSLFPQADRGLQRIIEESCEGSELDESRNRKRKNDNNSSGGIDVKRGHFCEISVTPLRKTSKTSSLNLQNFIAKSQALKSTSESIILHNPDEYLKKNLQNPYILATTGNVDPFLSVSSYYEPRWLDEQEVRFKKWLNLILIPPEYLRSAVDSRPVNIAKIWMECKKVEVEKAPTKEEISNKTVVSGRLDRLRASAVGLFQTSEVSHVLSKLAVIIENGKLAIRDDKKVHLDLGLQQEVMALFLSYNPLWLRLGLETIFGRTLKLESNSDIIGISFFIMSYFFKDAYLLQKYRHKHSEKYAFEIKKHVLKKFLMLIFFLDVAKEKRLLQYDPCLFRKNAPYKESKEILFKFTSVLLSAAGDITKCLKFIGYVLTHKQTYIHEFDYSVNTIGADLRDGVRLTRVMEVILLKDDLIPLMRVPAISRLQKIHNIKVAFTALEQAEYRIQQDITPKDIVDGHREKTLSLLWQIIYKFEAPLMKKATVTVQRWWMSLAIYLKRRVLRRKRERLEHAAEKIQQYYIGWKYTQKQRAEYLAVLKSVRFVQTWWRTILQVLKARKLFLAKRNAAIVIQRRFRAYKEGQQQHVAFVNMKLAAVVIQRRFRATLQMREARKTYINFKTSVVKIQLFYKSRLATRLDRSRFLTLKKSVLTIENWWSMLQERAAYNRLRKAVVYVQEKRRGVVKMRTEMANYATLKQSTITIQRLYRAKISMRVTREEYLKKKSAVTVIQRRFRDYKLMKLTRNELLTQRNAAICIQRYYRGYLMMKREHSAFAALKKTVLYVEEKRTAQLTARADRCYFLKLKHAAVYLQRKFRANRACKLQRTRYLALRLSVVKIQVRYRSLLLMRRCREDYELKKRSVVIVQRYYRGRLEMKKQVEALRFKLYVIKGIQRYIKGYLARMLFRKLNSPEALLLKKQNKAAIIIQAVWRGYAVRKSQSEKFDMIRKQLETISKENNTQKTIGSKKAEALQVLVNANSSYVQVIGALKQIEYITRRHKDSCYSLSEYLPEIITHIIITSGRSDPDSTTCIRGADILINFIKYPPSSANAWLPQYIPGLITTMVHWCDKDYAVFPLLATVVWLYARDETYLKEIKTTPNLKQQFTKMLRLCERKQKMVGAARRNASGSVLFAKYKTLPLPSIKPDWGLELKRPRAFTNSVHAVTALNTALGFDG